MAEPHFCLSFSNDFNGTAQTVTFHESLHIYRWCLLTPTKGAHSKCDPMCVAKTALTNGVHDRSPVIHAQFFMQLRDHFI